MVEIPRRVMFLWKCGCVPLVLDGDQCYSKRRHHLCTYVWALSFAAIVGWKNITESQKQLEVYNLHLKNQL